MMILVGAWLTQSMFGMIRAGRYLRSDDVGKCVLHENCLSATTHSRMDPHLRQSQSYPFR